MARATAIWNRDSILELLTRELARAAREGRSLCVMLAGIDQPGTIHSEPQPPGDLLLGEVAKRLSTLMRSYDHVGRYGPDQVLIILPGCELTSALSLAEKLRETAAQTPIETSGTGARITISVALALAADFPSDHEADLLGELSNLLHQAQAKGGNRVEAGRKLGPVVPRVRPQRRHVRFSLIAAGLVVAVIAVLAVVDPSSLCTPFLLRDILDSSELPPPLPADCAPTADRPSEATVHSLESQREARGLMLEGTVTCKIASSGPKDKSIQIDRQWLDTVYVNGALQYKRHVLIAASEDVHAGTLLTVEQCVMPWWSYVSQPEDRCWEPLMFWK